MLGILKSLFHRAPTRHAVDAVFHPRFPGGFSIAPVPLEDGAITFGAVGSAPWFNPHSEDDLKVLMGQPAALIETDHPGVLSQIGLSKFHPHNQCVIYQPWREPSGSSQMRSLGALTESMTPAIGTALAASPVKHLYLVTGGIFPGALTALKESLRGQRLETLGLFWYYSGDDITDEPQVVDEIVALCQACKTEKLSLLTAAVDSTVENKLVKGLANAPLLRECSVFEKDDHGRYPRFRTPLLDAVLGERSPG